MQLRPLTREDWRTVNICKHYLYRPLGMVQSTLNTRLWRRQFKCLILCLSSCDRKWLQLGQVEHVSWICHVPYWLWLVCEAWKSIRVSVLFCPFKRSLDMKISLYVWDFLNIFFFWVLSIIIRGLNTWPLLFLQRVFLPLKFCKSNTLGIVTNNPLYP